MRIRNPAGKPGASGNVAAEKKSRLDLMSKPTQRIFVVCACLSLFQPCGGGENCATRVTLGVPCGMAYPQSHSGRCEHARYVCANSGHVRWVVCHRRRSSFRELRATCVALLLDATQRYVNSGHDSRPCLVHCRKATVHSTVVDRARSNVVWRSLTLGFPNHSFQLMGKKQKLHLVARNINTFAVSRYL